MRPLLPIDLDMAVRVLLRAPYRQRPAIAAMLLAEAEVADNHRNETGRAHPAYGNGSVAAAAGMRAMARLPDHCDAAYCDCLAIFLDAFLHRHADHSAR